MRLQDVKLFCLIYVFTASRKYDNVPPLPGSVFPGIFSNPRNWRPHDRVERFRPWSGSGYTPARADRVASGPGPRGIPVGPRVRGAVLAVLTAGRPDSEGEPGWRPGASRERAVSSPRR